MKKKTRILVLVWIAGLSIFLAFSSAGATGFEFLGRPGNIFGYITQEVSYGLHNDYNTQHGINAALMNIFVEGEYQLADNVRFYGAGLLTVDWIYQLLHHDSAWDEKEFDKSKRYLNVDDEYWQLLNEAHVTWTGDHIMFRVGKQVVSWGEIMGPAIVSQWNPMDRRRGFASVELETMFIPIWLLRADYFVPVQWRLLPELNLQFVFNPNADFIPQQGGYNTFSGNDVAGIWALKIEPTPPILGVNFRIGSPAGIDLEEKDEWSEGHEFGFRVQGITSGGQVISLMGFYGYNNIPVLLETINPLDSTFFWPGGLLPEVLVLHTTYYEGYYPRQRFVAASFASDLPFLRTTFTGGVAPSVYFEVMFEYENTYALFINPDNPFAGMEFGTSNAVKSVLEIYYSVKIPALNYRNYFKIIAQLNYHRVLDADVADRAPVLSPFFTGHQDSYMTMLMLQTSYLHGKLTPVFSWAHDVRSVTDMFGGSLSYAPNFKWTYTLAGQFFNTRKVNEGFSFFEDKDMIYFKIAYKWG